MCKEKMIKWLMLPSYQKYSVSILELEILSMQNQYVDLEENKGMGYKDSQKNLLGVIKEMEKDIEIIKKEKLGVIK